LLPAPWACILTTAGGAVKSPDRGRKAVPQNRACKIAAAVYIEGVDSVVRPARPSSQRASDLL